MLPENTGEKRRGNPPVEHQFKPGNPGRPKGSRNKLSEKYTTDLLEEWERRGIEVLKALAPVDLVRAVGAVLPKEHNVRVGDLDEFTDDELARQLAAGLAALARAGVEVGPRAAETPEPQSLN